MSALRAAWLGWVVIGFGFLSAGASHEVSKSFSEAMNRGGWRFSWTGLVTAVRVYLADEQDCQRYLAYCNAWLGRPYQPYFVKALAIWEREESVYAQEPDVDAVGPITPARPLRPYRDFLVEYPPGFFLWAMPPALVTADVDGYRLAFCTWMALLLTVALLVGRSLLTRLAAPGAGRTGTADSRLVAWSAAAALALGVVVTHRYDAAVSLLLCAAVWAGLVDRPFLAGAALGAAVASKGLPIVAAPLFAIYWIRRGQLRSLAIAAGTSALVVAVLCVPLVWTSGKAFLDTFLYHSDRPIQVESTAGALFGIAHALGLDSIEAVHSFGSVNLRGPGTAGVAHALVLTVALAVGWLYFATWRWLGRLSGTARDRTFVWSVVAVLVATMVLGKVFSPQYLVWLLPLGLVAALARPAGGFARPGVLVLAALLSQAIYPASYHALGRLAPWVCVMVVARNLLLGAWCWSGLFVDVRATRQTRLDEAG